MPGDKSKGKRGRKMKLRASQDTCDLLKSAFVHLEDHTLPIKMNIIREEFLNKCMVEVLNSKASVLNKATAERAAVSVTDFMLQNLAISSRVIASNTPAGVPDPWGRLPHVKSTGNFRPPSDKHCQLRPTLQFTHFKGQSEKNASPKEPLLPDRQTSGTSNNPAFPENASQNSVSNAVNLKSPARSQHFNTSAKRARLDTLAEEPDDSVAVNRKGETGPAVQCDDPKLLDSENSSQGDSGSQPSVGQTNQAISGDEDNYSFEDGSDEVEEYRPNLGNAGMDGGQYTEDSFAWDESKQSVGFNDVPNEASQGFEEDDYDDGLT